MDFIEDFGAYVNEYSYIGEQKHFFCIRGLDHL